MKLRFLAAQLLLCGVAARALGQPAPANDDNVFPDADVMSERESSTAADSSKRQTPIRLSAFKQMLRAYSAEPTVEEVVRAALAVAKHDPERYVAMASRARWRGLLPHIDLGARRGQGIDLRWTASEDLEAHRTTADDVTLFATLRFDLDRLMFTSEEVSIAREARSARNTEHQLIRAVVRVYFLRRRLMLERDLLGSSSIAQQLRIQEAEALLNAFTDGAFQRMLKNRANKAKRDPTTSDGESSQAPTLPSGDRG